MWALLFVLPHKEWIVNYKHGCSLKSQRSKENPKWRLHVCWLGMKSRCDNPNNKQFKDWGWRGITYDPRWAVFENFAADMGEPPEGMTIDRIDNDGPYCKSNCRWASRKEQSRNRRMNRYLELGGRRMTIVEWSESLGVKSRLLRVRLNRGWTVERTLTTPCA
jgi:hypothetical protein